MRLLTAEQMRELDRRAIEEIGIPGVVLMENAGSGAAEALVERWAELAPGPVLVMAGKGNNGGDGFVIARHLHNSGWRVATIVLAGPGTISGDAGINLGILTALDGDVNHAESEEALRQLLDTQCPVLIVDALLGTGLSSEVRGLYRQAIDWINSSGCPVCSVDIPSGIDASSGAVLGTAVRAELTVTFAAAKVGHAVYPGAGLCGEVLLVDIGIPPRLSNESDEFRFVTTGVARGLLPERPAAGHKGTFGHVLIVAGGAGKSGAAVLTANGALRSGAGLVTLACPSSLQPVVAGLQIEAMTEALPEVDGNLAESALAAVEKLWEGKQSLAVGPGLGQKGETVELVRNLVAKAPIPLVVDADGLNALVGRLSVLRQRAPGTTILTPHPGEMARLLETSVAKVEADRFQMARRFAREHGVILVLKGARSVVAAPDGRAWVNGSGNPVLAAGGSGDLLAGLLGGLLAQGLDAATAAVLGVFVHGAAADRVATARGGVGILAGEIANVIPDVWKELRKDGDADA